jgi:hypothetical protein
LAARPDGSTLYTNGGQVWSGDLGFLLGRFEDGWAGGPVPVYVSATNRVFVGVRPPSSTDHPTAAAALRQIAEVDPVTYRTLGRIDVEPGSGTFRVNAAGTVLYVVAPAGVRALRVSP